nr:MAG: SigmaK-factor processing regulatory BofA [Bacillota bacterium]
MLYALGRMLLGPIRLVLKLIYNAVVGGLMLVLLNFIGNYVGLHIALNPLNALIVGFLGIPGVLLLIALNSIL